MRCEFPEVTRCCFCLPLRLGLLVWAYINIISLTVLFFMLLMSTVKGCIKYCHHSTTPFLFYIPTLAILLISIIFHTIFIISAHQKELKRMRIFYKYTIVMTALIVLGFFAIGAYMLFARSLIYNIFMGLFQLALFFWLIIIQIYVLILVRSEIVKLERNSNFQFTNHASNAAECTTEVDLDQHLAY